MRVADLESIRIKLASPEEILLWSHGEVTKPETINYRTQRSEKDGLFCEKIFGPEKDYECYCGKYRRIRYKGIICDKCGVEVTKSSVRRERMGHIKLACPVSHIWFLRGVPSRIGMTLDLPMQQLERVIYFAAYIITKVKENAKKKLLEEIEKEYKRKIKNQKSKIKKSDRKLKTALQELKEARDEAREEVLNLKPLRILSEIEYHKFSLKYGECFEAGTGAETLRKIFEEIDFKKIIQQLRKETEESEGETKRKNLRRLKLFAAMLKNQIRPEWMFLTVLPVLPPDLRPMVQIEGGRYASSDLNDLYRRVINRNNRLKYLLEISAPEVIVRNEKRMLQEAVDALIDNGMRKAQTTQATTGGRRLLKSLADMLKGKQGRFRQNLLGKRVDYSGRSVIVIGPELKHSQVGIPKKMALELFKPFVIKKVIERELAYNIRGASRLIEAETDEIWAILEEIVKDKFLLLNRAPTLHRLGIQAFQPVLIEGEAIRVPPLICKAFNADFDGDQMAVHLPLSEDAQKEARDLMFSVFNLLKPATGITIVSPTQDIILGCYFLTKIIEGAKGEGKIFSSPEEALLAYEFAEVDLRAKIKISYKTLKTDSHKNPKIFKDDFIETSVGRIIFNQAFPQDWKFINEYINSKKLERLINEIIEKYGMENAYQISDKIKEMGFEWSTKSGISWGMDDLIVPSEKQKLVAETEKEIERIEKHYRSGLLSKEEKSVQVIEAWQKVKLEIEKLVPKILPELGSVYSIIDSGAKGSWSQPIQMAGMKGLVINPMGQIIELPIKSSFKEGFNVLEYFISTHGARKGTADTALRTSTAGYLTRRLVDVSHEIVTREEDCKDEKGIEISKQDAKEIGQDFCLKIVGRVSLEDIKSGNKVLVKKGEIINWEKAREIERIAEIGEVKVRSPLTCKTSYGVCQKCYGWDLGRNTLVNLGEAVGIVAAQAIGEPGTQLTMRTFHTGGVAGFSDITQGLPRVDEVFEARPPVGKAILSEVDGEVLEIKEEDRIKVIRIQQKRGKGQKEKGKKGGEKKKTEIVEYQAPPKIAVWVEKGQTVKKGQQLCEGSLDLKELFKVAGSQETQRYIIKEIQKIYYSQGAIIHDKHVEVITRQMFSRVRVINQGDSHFTTGEIVEKSIFIEENQRLKKEGKKLATAQPLLLGISKVALTCESFLSAASFQETSRILIRAAIEGKEDKLRGLKENVIIGKLIPVGTGLKK
ncbi:MAG: DNA-directed RNA polymerase subunit beta' [Candidatus Nealsonbacteria bacterium CG23_combo_of_CG06-09_8_20_14_all_36_12]|uniref:DNA-directed RNA polymerase subunit beta' n=2 Tax=Candidatus Nealsoniibacteriota TaxID=1817911 RepID=A0A2H0TLR1_9BACT|nr:MAG: DNA-directed RNA polymerase subunit beta' [Candidatus Nealsonbacteria bacterium CG23_combo_of_CG06-09_8_20_14_all_36_12]PIR73083.1 MAG: DNA-directed RNA polymerase subunit beta' [Candidatus Nealsonbacteria bacterium CG10_big_fil_rev_8_21_14_0_10_36_23]